jgi:DNA-binding beta-propeller fold protein YncE
MSDFKRLLLYDANSKGKYVDYGEVVSLINEKLINVNVGGERDDNGNLVILESVMVSGDYVPKIGDWVGIEWRNGQPIAIGGNASSSSGLTNINNNVKVISSSDIAGNVIDSNHIKIDSIDARHIRADAIEARNISANAISARNIQANAITTDAISAHAVTSDKIAAGVITALNISANSITGEEIMAGTITARNISANSITGDKIAGNEISGNHIVANTIDASKLTVSAREFGLLGQYFTHSGGANKFEEFKGTRLDSVLNIDWGTGSPSIAGADDSFSIRWQGLIFAPEDGQYNFYIKADDGANLWIDNQLVVDAWSGHTGTEVSNFFTLSKNNWYTIRIDYYEGSGNASFYAKWKTPSMGSEDFIPAMYLTQSHTIIDGGTILTNTITASSIKVGTITAGSGVIGDLAITTALIANATITGAKIGLAEIKTANIASGNITTVLIADASITNAKIDAIDAGKITTGFLNASLISGGTITGIMISGGAITGDKIAANTIDTNNLRAGAVTATKIAAGSITTDRISAGAITGDKIEAGSINATHISTVGLDAQLISVYDSKTGETLIGGGYLRTEGLDVGVVQSDNLAANGLFLSSSSSYGFKRDNPSGEALLGSSTYIPDGNQIWKIDALTGVVVNKLDIPARKPVGIDIDETGTYAYVTVQGDNTLVQIDVSNFVLTSNKLNMGMGPQLVKWVGDSMDLGDHKHLFVLNTDPTDMNVPDSLMIIDAPPNSINGDLYIHHQIALGGTPYDFALSESDKKLYITQASQGDIVIIDVSSSSSMDWHVAGAIPISAFGTDNYHGGLSAKFGIGQAVGGDASSLYNADTTSGMGMPMGGMSHDHVMGYGASDGSLRNYTPHGIALSADSDTLYVVDYANGELLVISKSGSAPYNVTSGRHDVSSIQSPMQSVMDGEAIGGGPTTKWVRYRIPVGDEPESIEVVNGKIFITLEGSGKMAVIDESDIVNAINADRTFYTTWNNTMAMNPYPNISVRTIALGSKPSFMKVATSGKIYITLAGQNQIAVVDSSSETVTSLYNTGSNPKGITISPDGVYLYVVNNGGSGDLSFVYPMGDYIGDAYLGLEGMVEYQGGEFWTPNRTDWVYDASGNVRSSSTVEFRINEPFLNEGGYGKLSANGTDFQYVQIEQDIYNATNYSNGNNIIQAIGEKLLADSGNTVFYPRNEWMDNPAPSNIKIVNDNGSGGVIRTSANSSQYTLYYGAGRNSKIIFSGGVVPSGNWVEADYTAKNNLYFKPHNGSIEIAIENSSSPNFSTTFEIDELVPKFITVDNQKTSPFTPITDGINEEYSGLWYSVETNRGLNKTVTTSATPISGNVSLVTDGVQIDEAEGDVSSVPVPTQPCVELPSGLQSVKIDLVNTYMIGSVFISHKYGTDRIYHNTKTEVSEDGIIWTTIYDSLISGEYNEKPVYHPMHGHTHFGKFINFNALPVRYIRDWSNGWTSGDGLTSGNTNSWTEIKVFGDWELEKGYVYPPNSLHAGQQIATNGNCFVSTDIQDAYVSMDIQIEFTTWWYITYIVAPGFGSLKVEMPSMGMSHFLFLDQSYISKIAHRHIMPFPPSANIKEDMMTGVKAGKHRAVIRQASGKITIDRFRFEDFQFYNKSTLLITSEAPATFTRYKIVAEQAKWYIGSGNQSTFGAYDATRKNPDSGLQDYSVPIKYRMRVKSELNPSGNVAERGIAYATSAIFETGKQSTHWRRSESSDSYPASRIELWDSNQPHKTGIQDSHLANGAVRGEKILNGSIMDWHISSYARIAESKLQLEYPTHGHSNKNYIDQIDGLTTGGAIGSGNIIITYPYLTSNFYTKSQVDSLALSGSAISGNSVPVTRIVSAGTGLSGGGDLSSDISLFLDTTYTDGRYVKQSGNSNITGNVYVTGNIYLNGQQLTVGGMSSGNYVKSDISGQSVSGNFAILGDGHLWVGEPNGGGGQVVVRGSSGLSRIQLGGSQLTNTLAYLDYSGNAGFSGNVAMNTLTINGSGNIPNLNASYINSVQESNLAKNTSIYELGGYGVYSGLSVNPQAIPNMTVLISGGTVYTNTGRRVVFINSNVALTTPSVTYDRIDAVIVQGSSAGVNEGTFTVVTGTPSASPANPTLPTDSVLLAYMRVRQNAGSILGTDITDSRKYKNMYYDGLNAFVISSGNILRTDTINPATDNVVIFPRPIKGTAWTLSYIMATGNTSYTWNHSLNLTNYVISLSSNSPDRHIYWSGKSGNSIILNIDDIDTTPITIDAVITAY